MTKMTDQVKEKLAKRKATLEKGLKRAQSEMASLLQIKQNDYNSVLTRRLKEVRGILYQAMLKEMEITAATKKEVDEHHAYPIDACKQAMDLYTAKLNRIKIAEAQGLWYAQGTIVYLWSSGKKLDSSHSETTGTVFIYDGSQAIAKECYWMGYPEIGDYIVLYHKSNGTLRKMGDRITNNGKFITLKRNGLTAWYECQWLAEYDTPEDNILTRKQVAQQHSSAVRNA